MVELNDFNGLRRFCAVPRTAPFAKARISISNSFELWVRAMVSGADSVYLGHMTTSEVSLERVDTGWVVRVPLAGGKMQEFHCASEAMARRLAASVAKGPPKKPSRV